MYVGALDIGTLQDYYSEALPTTARTPDTEPDIHAEAHEQLLGTCSRSLHTGRPEVDSNLQTPRLQGNEPPLHPTCLLSICIFMLKLKNSSTLLQAGSIARDNLKEEFFALPVGQLFYGIRE